MPTTKKSVRKSRAPKRSRKIVKKSPKSRTRKSIKKSTRKSRARKSAIGKCRQMVYKKVSINLKEYKQGRYLSPQQAIAVAYSQIRKKHPSCKKYLTKKD